MTRKIAQALRRNTTALEARAWKLLRQLREEGIAIRRQHPVGRYVADFAAMGARLAIEIDGPLHQTSDRASADRTRDEYFQNAGWRVLRFTGEQMDDEIAFLSAVRTAASPSPRGEGAGGGVNPYAAVSSPPVGVEVPPAPLPPPLAGRGTRPAQRSAHDEEEIEPSLQRRTRANRTHKPRRRS